MSVPLDDIPEAARVAWLRLRDELQVILGEDLVAMWAYGGTTFAGGPPRAADLDTYVIVNRRPDPEGAQRIEAVHAAMTRDDGVEWDAWYVLADDARRPEAPAHAYREGRRDTSWAIHRAHWLADRYVRLHGPEPAEIVAAPTWTELEENLRRELEHLESHVAEGDTDPFEATYAILNGSRILRAFETGDVAISKRAAGPWALGHLPERWHPAIRAAGRSYDGQATTQDEELLAAEMAPFVQMVREHLPMPTTAEIDATFPVAGHEVYLQCRGGPGPTIVFEAAVGEDHTNWSEIAERVRDLAFVCVYDRIGVGRSTKPQPAVAAADHVEQLHELLEVAAVPRPVILVGHSYGGLVALMAAAEHQEDVAGLILVDSSHPRQDERIRSRLTDEQNRAMDEEMKPMAEVVDWPSSVQQAAEAYGHLPPMPLAVISSTRLERSDNDPPDYPYDAVQRIWADLQAEHARLRPDARHVMADAGHYVHVDDPDLVVAEIRRMLDALATA